MVNPYLNFDGQAEEAFNFYKSVFGGEFTMLQRFKEMPQGEKPLPAAESERIMHVSLPIGEKNMLMGSDISPAMGHSLQVGNNNYICLSPDSLEEGRRLYEQLSAGGKVEMPLEKAFWGDYFASFADRYGIRWMINVNGEAKA